MDLQTVEKRLPLMVVGIIFVVSLGGLAEIVPLVASPSMQEPVEGMKPLTALQLEGRDLYIREGCVGCHSQMIRPLRAETERYGHYSVAGESVWDHPFLWGSKRTGPDLARVGGRYSDTWHREHLNDPRAVVPESNMPGFPWLAESMLDGEDTGTKMRALRAVGVPYRDEDIDGASAAVAGKTELSAMIAYLQQLGTHLKAR
ncbi:MAG: cytochrome c oxidase cbb3-type subunit 2 [Myxococcota bacterium]|jgi:cytochrome c oxidase cbb3-type subunit 2